MDLLHVGLKPGDGSVRGTVKNSLGRRSVYTISTAVEEVSSLSAVQIPSSTSGRASIHVVGLGWPLEQQ